MLEHLPGLHAELPDADEEGGEVRAPGDGVQLGRGWWGGWGGAVRWRALVDFFRDEPLVVSPTDGERSAYALGLAQGELRGRQALAAELEQQFGIGGGLEEFTAQDAARVRARQVH